MIPRFLNFGRLFSATLGGLCLAVWVAKSVADDNRPIANPIVANYDETGRKLPPGVPRVVDTNGVVTSLSRHFTTPAYQKEALRLVIQEANRAATTLQLPERLPITETNLATFHISPFGFAYAFKMIGFVETENYAYYASVDDKLSYIEDTHQNEDCQKYAIKYTWPLNRVDTNAAYQVATQWLSAVSADVNGLNRDCPLSIAVDNSYVYPPSGKFVPIYFVSWNYSNMVGNAASARLFLPTKKLLQLRIEDPKYNLRKSLNFTNLDDLFPGIAAIHTNIPSKPIMITQPLWTH